jgi:hypothetical protein
MKPGIFKKGLQKYAGHSKLIRKKITSYAVQFIPRQLKKE